MAEQKISYIHPHPTGLALGLTAGIVYLGCVFIAALRPTFSFNIMRFWFHSVDLERMYMQPQITMYSFIIGLITVVVFFYVVGAIFAGMYNLCLKHCVKKKWI